MNFASRLLYYIISVVSADHKSNELDRYSLFLVSDTDRDEDPIMFWNRNAKTFSELSKIATNLISIPATSVKSEKNINAAGCLVEDKRTYPNSDTIDDVLFIKSNANYFDM